MIVDVSGGMTLAQVIIRLREAQGDSVTVRILPDSSLLLTANEFRALSLAAEREQVAIAVETDDALRRQLASLFGVPLSIPIPAVETEDVETAEVRDGNLAAGAPVVNLNGEATDAPAEPAVDAGAEESLAPEPTNGAAVAEPAARRKTVKKRGRSARWIVGLFGLAALLALAVVGYWWFFGTATAQITLQTQPVTTNVSFTVVAPGEQAAENGGITIPGMDVSFDRSVTLDAPATGSVTVGDLAASGSVVLRNPGDEAITIAAGSEITTFEGDVFVFNEDVAVPAATPEGTAGEATGVVSAATPGAASNRDLGMLSGRLENGVYFSNRTTPVAGGTDHTITVVTEEDLAGLQAEVEQALMSLATTSNLSGNLRVVPSSLTISNTQTEFSQQAGDEAGSIVVEATATFDAVAFPTESLDAAARESLPASVPEGLTLLPVPVTYDVPVETGQENGSWAMIVPATGQASTAISDEQLQQIERDLAGMSESEAEEYLEANELVTSYSLDFDPGWMPHRIPDDTGRITVEVK
jgi:hypothetical protein